MDSIKIVKSTSHCEFVECDLFTCSPDVLKLYEEQSTRKFPYMALYRCHAQKTIFLFTDDYELAQFLNDNY